MSVYSRPDTNLNKPKSRFMLPLQQRKFHRCVLAASPFFENILKGNFVETQTGLVEIKIETSSNEIEMALMFLYGRKPAFTIDSVGGLLELAEFFIIKGLKSACINWIRSEDITKDNCMYVMQLSTKYNFEVTTCIKYIESHLPETFRNKDAVNLSIDSVQYLFSDERLSYVTMDDKLKFLVQWVKMNPSVSPENITALFKTIDAQEVSYSIWENAKSNVPLNEVIDFDSVIRLADDDTHRHDILIMACDKGCFWCLDIQKDRWYRLNSKMYESPLLHSYGRHYKIAGMRNTLPEIYTVSRSIGSMLPTVFTVNLETDETKTYELTMTDVDITDIELANVCLIDDTILTTVNKRGRITKVIDRQPGDRQSERDHVYPGPSFLSASREEERERQGRNSSLNVRQIYLPGTFDNEYSFCLVSGNDGKYVSVKHIVYSEIYVGSASDETVEMSALFSIPNVEITETCLNRQSAVALLTNTNKVFLFDLVDCKIETIELQPERNHEMTPTEDGFLIYNVERCYCLKRLSGPSLSKKYLMTEIELENKRGWVVRYRCCNGIWIRILHKLEKDDIELQYVSHEELSISKSPGDIDWKQLSVPNENEIINKLINDQYLFVVPLSKDKLRCHIECPHCELSGRQKRGGECSYSFLDYLVDSSDDGYMFQSSSDSESD